MKRLLQLVVLLTFLGFEATAQNYPSYSISQISNVNANGDADSLNVQCSVSGTVFTPNYTNTGVEFFIHDHTGGLLISDPTNTMFTVNRTDSVQVFGTLSQTSGMLRMDADSIVVISTGNTETSATPVSILTEADESELVQLTGLTMTTPGQWLGNGTTFFVNTTDGTNQFIIIIKENTPMSTAAAPTGPFDVVGVVAQEDITVPYLQRYEIWPRDLTDFNFLPPLPQIDFDGPNLQVDEASGTTTVTMSLDQVTTTHDTLVITMTGGGNTATDSVDYIITPATTNSSFTLTLAPGDDMVSFDVAIIDDLIVEGNESIRFTVASTTTGITVATGGGGGPGGGAANLRITILDNEIVPTIDFVGPNIQVDEASGTTTVILGLDMPAFTYDTVTVGLAGGGNTADEGLDYTTNPSLANGTFDLVFTPGDTAATFDVSIIDDAIFEGDENIRLTIVATTDSIQVPTGGGPGGGGANYLIAIIDNEIIPTIDFVGPNIQVDEASGTTTVTLGLDMPALTNDTVTVGIAGGNADQGVDYTTTPTFVNDEIILVFTPGDTAVSFDVNIIDDGLLEGNENVRFSILAVTDSLQIATGGGGPGGGGANYRITILDNETAPTVSFSGANFSVLENSGTTPVELALDMTAINHDTLTISLLGPSSATEGLDFTTTPAMVNGEITLYVAPGDDMVSFDLNVVDDTDTEGNETAIFRITDSSDSILFTNGPRRITIVDNEGAPTALFSSNLVTIDESIGNQTVVILISTPTTADDTLFVELLGNSTATYGTDFTTNPPMVNDQLAIPLPSGTTGAGFDISVIDDADLEGDENARFRLSATGGITVGGGGGGPGGGQGATMNVIITDNDAVSTTLFEKIDFKVYPNPANQLLTIEAATGDYQLELRNMAGQLVQQVQLTQRQTIDVSQLPQGVYLLSVYNENGVGTKKVIITH